jgi:hypothetical protein
MRKHYKRFELNTHKRPKILFKLLYVTIPMLVLPKIICKKKNQYVDTVLCAHFDFLSILSYYLLTHRLWNSCLFSNWLFLWPEDNSGLDYGGHSNVFNNALASRILNLIYSRISTSTRWVLIHLVYNKIMLVNSSVPSELCMSLYAG